MLFKSPLLSQASGSVAGSVFSHNKGGMYMRARTTPVNPNTDAQQSVRDSMRVLVDAWTNTLTQTERDSWNLYAFNTPLLNKLGDPTKRTGQNMFVRSNLPRLHAAMPVIETAPVTFDLGSFTPLTGFTADASADTFTFNFGTTDPWANAAGGVMFIYQSRPVNPTVLFFKGPWQLGSIIEGDPTPPTSPHTFNSLFGMTTGQRVYLKVRVGQADGRLSEPQIISALVTA